MFVQESTAVTGRRKNFKKQGLAQSQFESQYSQHVCEQQESNNHVYRTKSKGTVTPSKACVREIRQRTVSSKKIELFRSQKILTCPICLDQVTKPAAKTECGHIFCFQCISVLTNSSNKCPCCRSKFKYIQKQGEIIKVQEHEQQKKQDFDDQDDYISSPCLYCGTFDDISHIVLCDQCSNYIVHTYCDPTLRGRMPAEWKCPFCITQQQNQRRGNQQFTTTQYNFRRR